MVDFISFLPRYKSMALWMNKFRRIKEQGGSNGKQY